MASNGGDVPSTPLVPYSDAVTDLMHRVRRDLGCKHDPPCEGCSQCAVKEEVIAVLASLQNARAAMDDWLIDSNEQAWDDLHAALSEGEQ